MHARAHTGAFLDVADSPRFELPQHLSTVGECSLGIGTQAPLVIGEVNERSGVQMPSRECPKRSELGAEAGDLGVTRVGTVALFMKTMTAHLRAPPFDLNVMP